MYASVSYRNTLNIKDILKISSNSDMHNQQTPTISAPKER